MAIGGPVLNAVYLNKYMPPEYESLLVVGEKEDHEQSADYLADNLGIRYVKVKGMGRSLNPLSDFGAYRELKKIMRDFKPDIVHTHAAKPGALGRLAAASLNVPVILHTFHGHVFHSYFHPLKTKVFLGVERFLAKKSSAIIAISELQKKELSEQFHIAPPEKFRVVPLGFDLDRFVNGQDEKRKAFRAEFNVADDEIAIGIIGRLVPVKNHRMFLAGIQHLVQHTGKKFRAFIIGDGETRAELERVATEMGLAYTTTGALDKPHKVVFTSWRSDVDVINAGLDIVCLTSLNEGTPVSLIEAQAANKPIVATRVGGIGDIVKEGETALLGDVTDTPTFTKHLLQLVEDDELRNRMGANSRSHVLQKFSYQRLVRDMSALYSELLNKK